MLILPKEGGFIPGQGSTFAIGKEFWFSSEIAFGINLFYIYHAFHVKDPYTDILNIKDTFHNEIYGITFSLTYN